jgi:putative ABC transport system permease protein
VVNALKGLGLPVLEEAPIITMRLASIKGRPTDQLLNDKSVRGPGWALRREYRSTWRTQLTAGEELVAGRFAGSVPEGTTPIPVSLEDGIARELGVTLGDELVFDVQGILMTNRVESLRKVDWRQVRPNFFVVFPAGALEAAPSMHVLATHVANPDESARMQREMVKAFPNVSAIDLTLVLKTLDEIVGRVGMVVRFMALFTVVTGLVVLVGAILTGRWQRVQEGILLRTLGATRAQIQRILFAEYLFLGSLASIAGSLLAVGSSWALAVFAFKSTYSLQWLPVLVAWAGVTALTVVVGMLASRGVCDQPPLEILRREA